MEEIDAMLNRWIFNTIIRKQIRDLIVKKIKDELKIIDMTEEYYDSADEFVDTSGLRIPANLTANITDGAITSINVLSGGRGYNLQSAITASSTSGEGATFELVTDDVGRIVSVTVLNGGTDYDNNEYLVDCSDPLTGSLSLFYKFNELSGTTALDSSVNSNDGTLTQGVAGQGTPELDQLATSSPASILVYKSKNEVLVSRSNRLVHISIAFILFLKIENASTI